MRSEQKHLARMQLEETLKPFHGVRFIPMPAKGWIRAVQDALGMTGRQLAKRLKVKPPRITTLEQDETEGRVTLDTLRRTAEAMDCVVVYAIVPRSSLEETVKRRVEKVVQDRMLKVSHSMALEGQRLEVREQSLSYDAAVEEMMRKMPRSLWSDK